MEGESWDNVLIGARMSLCKDRCQWPHIRLYIRDKTREGTLRKGHKGSNGHTWIPYHLLPHDVEDHVSQEQDLEK